MTEQNNIQELIQKKEYQEPKELRQILTYYKLKNKLNNIYFDLEKNSFSSVKVIPDSMNQIITGKKESLTIDDKIKITFFIIRLLNLYKPLNHVLIFYKKENLQKWQINLDSLLTSKSQKTYENKPQYQLLQKVETKDIKKLWLEGKNNLKNNLKTVCLLSEASLNTLAKENQESCNFKDYDLVIFENFKQTGKTQEYQNKIAAKYKAIFSFSDAEICVNKYPILKEINTKELANYCFLVKPIFTKEKLHFGNSNYHSREIIKFIEDFMTIQKKGICKLNKDTTDNQYKFELSDHAQLLSQEILKYDKKNSNFYKFNINSLKQKLIFNPNFIPENEPYSLIDAGHPVIKWIQSQIKISEIHPLSACKLP